MRKKLSSRNTLVSRLLFARVWKNEPSLPDDFSDVGTVDVWPMVREAISKQRPF